MTKQQRQRHHYPHFAEEETEQQVDLAKGIASKAGITEPGVRGEAAASPLPEPCTQQKRAAWQPLGIPDFDVKRNLCAAILSRQECDLEPPWGWGAGGNCLVRKEAQWAL